MFVELNGINGIVLDIDELVDPNSISLSEGLGSLIEVSLSNNRSLRLITTSLDSTGAQTLIAKLPKLKPGQIVLPTNELEHAYAGNQILRALRTMRLHSESVLFVGRNRDHILTAQNLHLGTVLISSENSLPNMLLGADFLIEEASDLKQILSGDLGGYLGEALAAPSDSFILGQPSKVCWFRIPHPLVGLEVVVTGRYFLAADPRFSKHAFSARIISFKNHPNRHMETFARIIGNILPLINNGEFDIVTRIPPKPSSQIDKLGQALRIVPRISKIEENRIRLDALKCLRDYPPQHTVGSYENRQANVEDVFLADDAVRGKSVVLIDDILTSGSTIKSAIDCLKAKGCKSVYPLVLAIHPSSAATDSPAEIHCQKCGGLLAHRFNRTSGQIFWGCENYWDDPGGHTSLRFIEGVRRLNVIHGDRISALDPDRDIPF